MTAEWRVYDARRSWIAVWGGGGETLASPDVAGSVLPVVPTGGLPLAGAVNPAGPDGPVVAGGPVGQCETPSPSLYGSLDPLEHSVLDYARPDGRHVAVGPVGPFRTLSSSDCHPAGPAGPYVAGGLVDPDASSKVLEPLEHAVLDHADPAGQHAAVGTLSPSDCYPVGPAGPYITGGPVGPDDFFKVLEPLEPSVLDHADPAGQHADVHDTLHYRAFGFGYGCGKNILSGLKFALDSRPMEGIITEDLSGSKPLEHSVSDMDVEKKHTVRFEIYGRDAARGPEDSVSWSGSGR